MLTRTDIAASNGYVHLLRQQQQKITSIWQNKVGIVQMHAAEYIVNVWPNFILFAILLIVDTNLLRYRKEVFFHRCYALDKTFPLPSVSSKCFLSALTIKFYD